MLNNIQSNIEAESCVLGSMMLDTSCIDVAASILSKDCFVRPAHGIIFYVILQMSNDGKPVDFVTVRDSLERKKLLDKVGGIDYVVSLAEGTPSTGNIEYYSQIVKDYKTRRDIIALGDKLKLETDSHIPAQELLDIAESSICEISNRYTSSESRDTRTISDTMLNNLMETAGKRLTGIATGYPSLDDMTRGLQAGEFIIIAARPSMGKTALLLNIAEYMSIHDKTPIGFFSLEMPAEKLLERMLSSVAGVNLREFRHRIPTEDEYNALSYCKDIIGSSKLYIEDCSSLSIYELRSKARRMVRNNGVKAIFVDYLQLISESGINHTTRNDIVGVMSRMMKSIARELDIPVIVAAQINRGNTNRTSHIPRMSDIRESGSIEQDADVIMMLHNEDYYHRGESDYQQDGITKLIVEKQRNGPTGVIDMCFQSENTKFIEKSYF